MSRYLLAFDGTGHDNEPGRSKDSIVARLADTWRAGDRDYIPGVGMRVVSLLRRALDIVLAIGAIDHQVAEGLRAWREAGCPTCVAIIGWSRGARAAQLAARSIWNAVTSEGVEADIRVVLLDVVPTQGLPWVRWLENQLPYSLALPGVVTLHLMAGQEHRLGFQLRRVPGAIEVWLPGHTHSGVAYDQSLWPLIEEQLAQSGVMVVPVNPLGTVSLLFMSPSRRKLVEADDVELRRE